MQVVISNKTLVTNHFGAMGAPKSENCVVKENPFNTCYHHLGFFVETQSSAYGDISYSGIYCLERNVNSEVYRQKHLNSIES